MNLNNLKVCITVWFLFLCQCHTQIILNWAGSLFQKENFYRVLPGCPYGTRSRWLLNGIHFKYNNLINLVTTYQKYFVIYYGKNWSILFSTENKEDKDFHSIEQEPLTRGYAIYNFGKNPFLFITISKDNLSDVCPGVEKKSCKEIVHFHYTTKMATWGDLKMNRVAQNFFFPI